MSDKEAAAKGGHGAVAAEEVLPEEPIRLDGSEREVWLVKVPQFVDKAWRAAIRDAQEGDGQAIDVGEVVAEEMASTSGASSSSTFKLSLSESFAKVAETGAPGKQIPRSYQLVSAVSSKALTRMHALADGGGWSMGGRVMKQLALKPKIDKSYRAISRERMRQATASASGGVGGGRAPLVSRVLLDDSAHTKMEKAAIPLPVSYVGGAKYKREQGRKQSDYKRVKMENKDNLMKWLFDLFSREPYWRFDAIQKTTEQPTRFLMEVLKEVAQKVFEGENAGKWELKEMYRQG